MESAIKLSVLICSLANRKTHREHIVGKLQSQISSINGVEINVNIDNGELNIGAKRNKMIEQANGEYVAFVDDDDDVSDDYIASIMDALENGPDCVGIEGIIIVDDKQQRFCHSIEYSAWYTGSDGVFYRTPNHLNPIRRSIAIAVGFPNDRKFGEDQLYSEAIRKHLKTEQYIDHPIYFYNCSNRQWASQ